MYLSTIAGHFVHESICTTSKTLAREAERQRRRELEKKWNRIEKRSLPPTLTEAAKRWLDKRASLSSNTRETYESALKHVPACENGRIDSQQPIANWRTTWRRACREAGLDGLRFHDLRHTAATKLLEEGTPIAVVAHILGWSASTAVRMAKRYGHIRPEVQRQALNAVATDEIRPAVNQIVHQVENTIESKLPN